MCLLSSSDVSHLACDFIVNDPLQLPGAFVIHSDVSTASSIPHIKIRIHKILSIKGPISRYNGSSFFIRNTFLFSILPPCPRIFARVLWTHDSRSTVVRCCFTCSVSDSIPFYINDTTKFSRLSDVTGTYRMCIDASRPCSTFSSVLSAIYNTNAFFSYIFTVKFLHLPWGSRRLLAVLLATFGVMVVVYGGGSQSDFGKRSDEHTSGLQSRP